MSVDRAPIWAPMAICSLTRSAQLPSAAIQACRSSPILTNADLRKRCKHISAEGGWQSAATLDPILATVAAWDGSDADIALERLAYLFDIADRSGRRQAANILVVLSDRGESTSARVASTGAAGLSQHVHHHLIRKGDRTKRQSGARIRPRAARSPPSLPVYSATEPKAINPYLAFEAAVARHTSKANRPRCWRLTRDSRAEIPATKSVVKKGMHQSAGSKMGISTHPELQAARRYLRSTSASTPRLCRSLLFHRHTNPHRR